MGGVPNNRILQYHTGNRRKAELGGFELELNLTARESCQIRHTALEAARVISNATIRNAAGVDGYSLKIHTYPHHVLRENKQATGAGADRVSMGMRKSFGRTVGTAARVKSGQKLITLRTSDEFASEAKEALRKSSHKLPTPCNIVVNQK